MMKKITQIISGAMLLFIGIVNAQSPALLKDINTNTTGGSGVQPSDGAALGSVYYFAGKSSNGGNELWKTDGTTSGTVLVSDIRAGGFSSDPYNFKTFGSFVYFVANDGKKGEELWKTDGTSAGTVLVSDIYSGSSSSSPNNFIVLGDNLYFVAYTDANNIYENTIFKIDANGNLSIVINPNGNDIFEGCGPYNPDQLTAVGNTLFFTAYAYLNNCNNYTSTELFKTDGTEQGTALVKDIYLGSNGSSPDRLTAVGSTLYFRAHDEYAGRELFKSDGTAAGTTLVIDLNPGGGSASIGEFIALGNKLLFSNYDYLGGNTGTELWQSDGTLNGTKIVSDVYNGGSSSDPYDFTVLGSNVYFASYDGFSSGLYKTDGTSAGTVVVSHACYLDAGLMALGSTLYFNGYDNCCGTTSYELWKSDGTSVGTVLLNDIRSGSGNGSYPNYFGAAGNNIYFQADDGVNGDELWKTDGTSAGTILLQVGKGLTQDANISNITKVGNNFFFTSNDGVHGIELWMSDGTAAGSFLVKDINNGGGGTSYSNMMAFGSDVIFNGNSQLYRSDGTSSGTLIVNASVSSPRNFLVMGNTFYFNASSALGAELWKSDGTSAGTVLVSDIFNGGSSSDPQNLTVIGSSVYFTANTALGRELWKTDGTSAGTILVKDIIAGGSSSNPKFFNVIGSNLVFLADDGVNGLELWTSDGSSAGTARISNINPSGGIDVNGYNIPMVSTGSSLFLNAYNPTYGYELWKSDGTSIGTQLVKDIYSGGNSSRPNYLTIVGSSVYFIPDFYDNYLYKSDGTSTGTVLVDKNHIAYNPYQGLTAVGSSLVAFLAYDNVNGNGYELFISDGSTEGTYLAGDIYSGGSSSSPSNIVNINNSYLVFNANSGFEGNELWKYNVPSVISAGALGNILCPGVPYNVTYTVTQGLLNTGNKFNVELSDGLGSFESPTIIGTLSGNASSGSISATIPNDVSGLGYKIRVAATDQPSYVGVGGSSYYISTPPVTFSGKTVICPGGSTNIVANGGDTYVWSNGTSSRIVTISTAGSLSVTVTDVNGCSNTKGITIAQDTVPTITISGNTTYCIGESTTLTASGATSYSWNPQTGISDPASNVVTFTGSNSTKYTLTATGAACSAFLDVNMTVATCNKTVGINELAEGEVDVYPNPANGSIYITANLTNITNATVRLTSMQGDLIYEENNFQPNGIYSKSIDVTTHAKGIYLLQVITNNGITTNRIIVQ